MVISISHAQWEKLDAVALIRCPSEHLWDVADHLLNETAVGSLVRGFRAELERRNKVGIDGAFENPTFQAEIANFYVTYARLGLGMFNKPTSILLEAGLDTHTVLAAERTYLASVDPLTKAAAAGEIWRVLSERALDFGLERMPFKKLPGLGPVAVAALELGIEGLTVPVAWLTAYSYNFIRN